MLIGGALANTLVFIGSSYLFHRLSKDSIDAERARHDLAIEKLQKPQIEWAHKRQERIDFMNKQRKLERKAGVKFTEMNDAMREYHEAFGHELPPLPREPVLSDYYTPTDKQHYRELEFIALSMIWFTELEDYSKAKQLTRLVSTENNLSIRALSRGSSNLPLSYSRSPF